MGYQPRPATTNLHSPTAIGDVTPNTVAATTLLATLLAAFGGIAPEAGYALTIQDPDNGTKTGVKIYANNLSQNVAIGWQGLLATQDFDIRTAGDVMLGTSGDKKVSLFTNGTIRATIKSTGVLNLAATPTSASGLASGDVYSNAGILTIVP